MAEGTTSEDLKGKAVDAGRAAMEQYADSHLHRFAMEATWALEMGAKAALAKVDPVLIADPHSVESQLYLAGHPATRARGDRRIRTVSCKEALQRVAHLLPTLRVADVERLISVRDGSTHFLVNESEAVESLVVPFLTTFQLLQQLLELSDGDVFGSYTDLVKSVREKHTKEVDRKVAAKIARAKHAFEERYGHFDANTLKVALDAMQANISLDGYDEQKLTCPACGGAGVIRGQHKFQRWEADVDEHGDAYPYPVVTLFAYQFNCPACGLHLEGDDELVAAGLETALDVENVDPEDFYDEDDFGDDWDE